MPDVKIKRFINRENLCMDIPITASNAIQSAKYSAKCMYEGDILWLGLVYLKSDGDRLLG